MENEETCKECGSLRGSNIYCWGCGEKMKPLTNGTAKPSEGLDNAKKQNAGDQRKIKRISKRTKNKDGRFRKKRSDTGKPRRKKNESKN